MKWLTVSRRTIDFLYSRRWFKIGKCSYCGEWGLYILKGDRIHEHCWLETK